MRKIFFYFLGLLLLLRSFSITAQSASSPVMVLKDEQNKLLKSLKQLYSDSTIVYPLSDFIVSGVKNIYSFISADDAMTVIEKEKAVRSMGYFIKALSENLAQKKMELYDIPGAMESYENILSAVLYHKPFNDLLIPLGARASQCIAAAFSQYQEYPLLNDIAVYKAMAASPEFIMQFLESKPGFRFADSLLLQAAAFDPMKMTTYLNGTNPGLQKAIVNNKNIYLQQIISISQGKNIPELLPFVTEIAEKKITGEEILETRMDITKYFQLLVNTLKESGDMNDPSLKFKKLLRKGLKEKSLSFYVNQINALHSSADAIRFAAVKDLRPEDLYYLITSSSEELYTSSYLGLYKRLMEYFKNQSADSLFSIVQHDNFRTFMRMAANYNVLTNFLNNMPQEKTAEILNRFISGIESDINSGLEKAMDIADSFNGLDSAVAIRDMIQNELRSNLSRCQSGHLYFGIRLYSILLQVFDLVQQKNSFNELWATLGNYEMLKRDALQNKNGEIIELVLFYGDEDGVASFSNFLGLFKDAGKWKISKNKSWVSIRSVSDQPIIIYANIPLDNKEEMDLKAQDSLIHFLQQQSTEPVVLIHRGHSYHLDNTLKRLRPSIKLAILGSCGGYNNTISISTINPDVQIIVSKKIGSKSINDPIIDLINQELLNKKDLSWPDIWEKLAARFSKDETAFNLFNEYIPPGKNVSLFVLKLFNFYNRPV